MAASLYKVDTDPVVDEFALWYHGRYGAEPDCEAAEALADEKSGTTSKAAAS